ncbi:RNA ligase [Natronobiforma cellulositropha]|uniref:RNA ligase n=1 Tax=Natronobiforma cellulositropha TaxID=1679076 RepID=UPI0021D5AE8F|nr:RNA ligase [Natronobiforma cellulositropha]
MTAAYHEALECSPEVFSRLEEHFRRQHYEGRPYRYLPNARGSFERGTVLIGDTVVRGYPKIGRTLVLEPGIESHFDGDLAIEEKLNGYNVRVVRLEGDLLAFTRSGLVCPFTTRVLERRQGAQLGALFDAYPSAMVCGEMIGPESPYIQHEYPGVDSLAFRAFDWREREGGEPVPVAERRHRYARFEVPQTRLFAIEDADAAAAVCRRVVKELERDGREGVVLQSADGDRQVKYTAGSANRGDLAYAFSLPFDYGREFVFRRVVREAFQSHEFGESAAERRARAHRLGEAILLPMLETISHVEAGQTAGERHTVRADAETVDALLAHLREQGLTLEVVSDRETDGERVVTFTKRAYSTSDSIDSALSGHVFEE